MSHSLAKELGWILVIKVIAIALIWWLFFSETHSLIEPAAHILN
ncbi:cytochrome oxidase putative small subunit CydP [Mariprofundus erugo]